MTSATTNPTAAGSGASATRSFRSSDKYRGGDTPAGACHRVHGAE